MGNREEFRKMLEAVTEMCTKHCKTYAQNCHRSNVKYKLCSLQI